MDYQHITTTDALEEYCQAVARSKLLAVDTEFMRERCYYPQLCLIQIASDTGQDAIVDPLADGLSLEPLRPLLTDPNIIKIFHSGDQDIELFHQYMGLIPSPVFDTQIAGQALGFGDSIAYHNLVQSMLDIRLDKSQQYTHWEKRPLKQAQLDYAIADVTHLLKLTPTLMERLKERGREEWIVDSHAALTDPARLEVSIPRIVKKIRHNLRKPLQIAVLHALVQWREGEAQRVNKPRGFIMKDEVLAEIAKKMPETTEQLSKMRLLTPIRNADRQRTIIGILDDVRSADAMSYPAMPKRPSATANNELVGLLSLVLKQRCSVEQVASKLIANRKDLEQIALGREDLACMQGWRNEIFGKYAKKLMAGKLHFHWDSVAEQVVMD